MIFDKDAKAIQWENWVFSIIILELDIHIVDRGTNTDSYCISYTNITSKHIIEQTFRNKNHKYFCSFGIDQDFSERNERHKKNFNFWFLKATVMQQTKISATYISGKGLVSRVPECIKNSYNSTRKKKTPKIWRRVTKEITEVANSIWWGVQHY